MCMRTTLADAFHQAGRLGDARTLFEKAERCSRAAAAVPRLYSFQATSTATSCSASPNH